MTIKEIELLCLLCLSIQILQDIVLFRVSVCMDMNLGKLWEMVRVGKPDALQSMRSQSQIQLSDQSTTGC